LKPAPSIRSSFIFLHPFILPYLFSVSVSVHVVLQFVYTFLFVLGTVTLLQFLYLHCRIRLSKEMFKTFLVYRSSAWFLH
jgi:hypothetical protein